MFKELCRRFSSGKVIDLNEIVPPTSKNEQIQLVAVIKAIEISGVKIINFDKVI